jgi:UDP-glucose 4-epimerase
MSKSTTRLGSTVSGPVDRSGLRPGDAVGVYAKADLAEQVLGWRCELSVRQAIEHPLAWMRKCERARLGAGVPVDAAAGLR